MSNSYSRNIACAYRQDLPEAPNTILFRAFDSLWRRRGAARWVWSLALASAFNPSPAISQTTFAVIDVPGASYTHVNGINNSGAIVGTYGDSAHTNHEFLLSGSIYQTLDVPGFIGVVPCLNGNSAFAETATGINNGGQVVGLYDRLDPTIPNPCLGASFKPVGFLLMNGSFQDY